MVNSNNIKFIEINQDEIKEFVNLIIGDEPINFNYNNGYLDLSIETIFS